MAELLTPGDLHRIPLHKVDRSLKRSAVYFLFDGEVVVYVGQSCDVLRRVGEHIADQTKTFDAIATVDCINLNRTWLERRYIDLLKPRYNGQAPRPVRGQKARKARSQRQPSLAQAA
jgi:hypothetical protein